MIATLIAIAAVVQNEPAASAPPGQMVVRRQGPAAPKVTGDFAVVQLDLSADIPAFSAEVGGKTVKLAFDTGAPGPLRLTDSVASGLGLSKIGEARASDPSGRNPIILPIYSLASAKIGGLEIRDWDATGSPPRAGKLAAFDGIIGLSAFHGFVVTLDYASSQLEIRRGSLPPADGKTIFKYQGDPIPNLPLTIDGKTMNAHLDTGNSAGPVIVPEQFAKALANYNQAKVVGRARTVSNEMVLSAFDVAVAPSVGAVTLNTRQVVFPSVAGLANIGSKALKGMVVRIDPANGLVQLEAAPPAAT